MADRLHARCARSSRRSRLRCVTGCSSSPDENSGATAAVANVRLTKAQRSPYPALHRRSRRVIARRSMRPARSTSTTTRRLRSCLRSPDPSRASSSRSANTSSKGQPLASGPVRRLRDCDRRLSQGRGHRRQRAKARRCGPRPCRAQRHFGARGCSGPDRRRERRGGSRSRAPDAAFRWVSIVERSQGRWPGSPSAGVAGIIRAPVSGVVVDKQITPGQLLQAGSSTAFTVANLSQVWVLAQIASSDLAPVGLNDAAPHQSRQRHRPIPRHGRRISPPRSIPTPARSSPGSSLPILTIFSRSRCTSTFRSNPAASAPACWCPSRRCFATTRTCRSSTSHLPDGSFARRHVTLGYRDSQNYDVTNGLVSGDRIVTNGAIFLQFMQSQ